MNKKDLLPILELANKNIQSRAVIPEFGMARITGDKIYAGSYDSMLVQTLPEDTGLDCCLPAGMLLSAVKTCPDEVAFKGGTGNVSVGGFRINTLPSDDYKLFYEGDTPVWIPTDGLSKAISEVAFAVGTDTTRMNLTCIGIKDGKMVATNAYMFASTDYREGVEMAIPFDIVPTILNTDVSEMAVTEKTIHFKGDGVEIHKKRDVAHNPEFLVRNVTQFCGLDYSKVKVTVDKEPLIDAVKASKGALEADSTMHPQIGIEAKEGTLGVSSESIKGEYTGEVAATTEGEGIWRVNPDILLKAITPIDDVVTIQSTGSEKGSVWGFPNQDSFYGFATMR